MKEDNKNTENSINEEKSVASDVSISARPERTVSKILPCGIDKIPRNTPQEILDDQKAEDKSFE